MSALPETVIPPTDVASREWLRSLRAEGATRNEAVERLHALLRRAARFEAARRRTVKLRKCAWQGRELPVEPEAWNLFSSVTFVSDAASSRAKCCR